MNVGTLKTIGVGMGLAAAGAGTAYVANAINDTGKLNKGLTTVTGGIGALGVVGGLGMVMWGGARGDMSGGFTALAGLLAMAVGGGSLAVAGGSIGVDILNWGQREGA